MSLFDKLVDEAIKNRPELSNLRIVVEKELLHHDILRILSKHDLLRELTFIGGTCLRSCYGGVRLSEDLDFTGGLDFSKKKLISMSEILISSLQEKYGLSVKVSEPLKETGNVDTWKIKIETKPEQKHLPSQRINIDICSVNSYERKTMMILNPYRVEMGTSGLNIVVESLEEIFTDKIIAFALRPNTIKNRDLWDIMWLHQNVIKPRFSLIEKKLDERNVKYAEFVDLYELRHNVLLEERIVESNFEKEMNRFLPKSYLDNIREQEGFWLSLCDVIKNLRVKF